MKQLELIALVLSIVILLLGSAYIGMRIVTDINRVTGEKPTGTIERYSKARVETDPEEWLYVLFYEFETYEQAETAKRLLEYQ